MLDLNNRGRPLSVGSLFSGYGGLDLAVEYALDAETVWFSENNQRVARIFAHHWPDAPNLGDITTIDWNDVPPVDVLCGGFPCQDVSTVGKRAGLAPALAPGFGRTWPKRSRRYNPVSWSSRTSAACCPHRLSAHPWKEKTMRNATPTMQPPAMQPFAVWNPTRGVWETSQLDLSGQPAPYSAIWPTCGTTHNGSAYQHPLSALLTPDFASSSSLTAKALFRTPLATDSARGGESLEQVRARRGTIALSHQIIDLALNGPTGLRNRSSEPEMLWSLIEDIFAAADDTPTPSPNGSTSPDDLHRLPRS
ncbi:MULTISPECIES: DNA cytosine methyltransferase [unclassified Microbacterium]|uniref:DNA cytosine methyltransferase n=1 Tax=unclassified Microbacterium TaxID=2609290 RepID=UPI0025EAD6AF|nr:MULTISPECIES: DNA cytosine methyltransferase [unclassified Microbacterium]